MARSEAQKRADKKYEKKRAPRKDYWLFEFYPDSAPENWREIINGWLVDCLVFLLRYARANRPEWFRCLCDNGTYVMKEYCKTAAFDARQAAR